MKNLLLRGHVRDKIDTRVERLLKELGNPQPPVNLIDVRSLLKLNRAYFSRDDVDLISQTLHRLSMAGRQVIHRPTLLIDAIKKFDLRALYLPDQKQILIDKTVPELKHRWLEAHETGHDLLDWHRPFMFGDDDYTPTPACHAKLEAEASYAGGQMIFSGARFAANARDLPPVFSSVQTLAKTYGNTITSTLWHYVESLDSSRSIVGVISDHPNPDRRSAAFDPAAPCHYLVQSPTFAAHFSKVAETAVFDLLTRYCSGTRAGPIGNDLVVLTDDNGDRHQFGFETFFNGHDALTLGVHIGLIPVIVGSAPIE